MLFCSCAAENILGLGRNVDVCEANFPPQCGSAPRCELTADEYLNGKFPGARRFIVRTEGAAKITFSLLLEHAKGAGTELLLRVQESNCSAIYTYDNMNRDIIELADNDGILKIRLDVQRGGDHPVEITSDAFADWSLIAEVENVKPTLE